MIKSRILPDTRILKNLPVLSRSFHKAEKEGKSLYEASTTVIPKQNKK